MLKLLAGILLLVTGCLAAAQIKVTESSSRISVSVDGQPVTFSGTGPRSVNNRILVPLRGVMEKIGATVGWDSATKTVTAEKGPRKVVLKIGNRTATIDGESVTLDVPAMIIGGSTMVPLRFMGEALGEQVVYERVSGGASGGSVVGVWYLLDSDGAYVKSTKITLTSGGTFLFQGSTWKSSGDYVYDGSDVTLIWTSVDGSAVQRGTMKKALPISSGATRMQLDTFTYGKYQ